MLTTRSAVNGARAAVESAAGTRKVDFACAADGKTGGKALELVLAEPNGCAREMGAAGRIELRGARVAPACVLLTPIMLTGELCAARAVILA